MAVEDQYAEQGGREEVLAGAGAVRAAEGTTTLTPTGRVILGMIALGKRTGYDIAPEATIESVRAMRAMSERKHAQLTALREKAGEMRRGPGLTLEIGLGVSEWLIHWCEATERRLAAEAGPASGGFGTTAHEE